MVETDYEKGRRALAQSLFPKGQASSMFRIMYIVLLSMAGTTTDYWRVLVHSTDSTWNPVKQYGPDLLMRASIGTVGLLLVVCAGAAEACRRTGAGGLDCPASCLMVSFATLSSNSFAALAYCCIEGVRPLLASC